MWTADNRPRYNRDKLRYPSDLTDAEWAQMRPWMIVQTAACAIREVINR